MKNLNKSCVKTSKIMLIVVVNIYLPNMWESSSFPQVLGTIFFSTSAHFFKTNIERTKTNYLINLKN